MIQETVDFVCQSEIFNIIPPPPMPPPEVIPSEISEVFTSSQPITRVFLTSPTKISRLECAISFVKKINNKEYSFQANQCLIDKLKGPGK